MIAKTQLLKTLSNDDTNAIVALVNLTVCVALYFFAASGEIEHFIVSFGYTLTVSIGVARYFAQKKSLRELLDTSVKQYMFFIHVCFYAFLTLS
ncbi:hypothetical protein [Vibrio crassostreae]|uniref:hypothetical protein n=1 Tax=Vibrio crassostreae TaxID=246167 RepID=UPI001B303120|nr:hypothetical protein [Vibrio crassostreae]